MMRKTFVIVFDAMAEAANRTGGLVATVLWWSAFATMQLVRVWLCSLLVLGEMVLGAVLVPLAVLGFLVTLVFGFLIDAPHFPRWGMLTMSVGCLVLYWLYLGLMSLFMSLPGHDHRYR